MSRFKHQICKPLYQIKAYRTSYQTIPNILKQMNCEFNFSRLLNANAQITFWMLHVKANFVFRLFNAFLYFRGQIKVVKTNVSAICHIQFQWKVTEHFLNRIKKYVRVIVQKSLLKKKYLEIKNLQAQFYFPYAKLGIVQIWEESNKFPLTCSSLKCLLLVKKMDRENSTEKICLLCKQTPPTNTVNWVFR